MSDKFKWVGVPQQGMTVVSSSTSAALLPDYKIWKPTPLPPDHQVYALIGRVASEWSHFEHMLDLIIWELANIEPEKGACITAQIMGPVPRLRTIITQLKQINTEESKSLADEFKQLMDKCHDVAEHRNRRRWRKGSYVEAIEILEARQV